MKIKILFISLFIALLNLNPAQAHTELVSVEPSTDQVMLTLPSEVKLTFGGRS